MRGRSTAQDPRHDASRVVVDLHSPIEDIENEVLISVSDHYIRGHGFPSRARGHVFRHDTLEKLLTRDGLPAVPKRLLKLSFRRSQIVQCNRTPGKPLSKIAAAFPYVSILR